jgi:hypothetical protein
MCPQAIDIKGFINSDPLRPLRLGGAHCIFSRVLSYPGRSHASFACQAQWSGIACVGGSRYHSLIGSGEMQMKSPRNADLEEPPPFGGTWKRIYLAVVIYTCCLILVLYWMTVTFNR